MAKYSSCPNCGDSPSSYGGYFTTYKCKDCNTEFCSSCAAGGFSTKCPDCGSKNYKKTGYVQ